MRLVETRLLDGPNVYRLEPTVKLEVVIGRRRTWYGQRLPAAHARVDLRAPVPMHAVPSPVLDLRRWVARLHALSGANGWLVDEGRGTTAGVARMPVRVHRTSEPGHWIVAWPWREEGRARTIGEAAFRLVELDLDPGTTLPVTPRTRGRRGRSRTLARALWDIAAADTRPPAWIRDRERRIPIISITGTNGKTTTTRMISHILRLAGRHVGTTTSDGVLIDEELTEAGDLTGPYGARTVLSDPRVEVAVLETARGGIVLRGVGYESNDASVFTNVSSDHMDLHGLHTLPELAQVKSTIARMTRPSGTVVLNADDPLVAEVARIVTARVCLFSMPADRVGGAPSSGSARVHRHLRAGGTAVLVDDGWLVEREGLTKRRIVEVAEVPVTLRGLARHNVANALAAAGGARALGATIEQVAAGLRTFGATTEHRLGRLDLYRRDGTVVIIDFAHNEAGVRAVLDVATGLIGDRAARAGARSLVMVIGTAGDRPDDALRGIARIAAERADIVAIKESLAYLRGRTRESVVGELRAGIDAGGGRGRQARVYEDEPASVLGELNDEGLMASTGLPGVLVVMCHQDRGPVVDALAQRGFEPVRAADVAPLT